LQPCAEKSYDSPAGAAPTVFSEIFVRFSLPLSLTRAGGLAIWDLEEVLAAADGQGKAHSSSERPAA